MAIGVILSHDEDEPLRLEGLESLQDLQSAVGGLIEAVNIRQSTMTLFMNEEGKILGLPINRRATLLWWLFAPEARHLDVLRGSVVLTGPPDSGGRTLDVPVEIQHLLLEARSFKIEVQTVDDPEAWNGNGLAYGDFFAAAERGLGLADRWTAVEHVRVVIAD